MLTTQYAEPDQKPTRDSCACSFTCQRFLQAHLRSHSWKGTHVGLRAAVERGPSQSACPGAQDQHGCPLPVLFTVRVLRARRTPGCCPPHPSEAARCTSIEGHQALSHPAFREYGTNGATLLLMRDLGSRFMELPPLFPQTPIIMLPSRLHVSACHPPPGH